MPGETGSDTNGESRINQSVQQTDRQDVVESNGKAHSTCPFCGQIPRQYGDVSATDNSMIVQGDIHTLYYCPNLGSLSETRREEIQKHIEGGSPNEITARTDRPSVRSAQMHGTGPGEPSSPMSRQTTRADPSGSHISTRQKIGISDSNDGSGASVPSTNANGEAQPEPVLTASFMGLKILTDEETSLDMWQHTFDADVASARIVIKDAKVPNKKPSPGDKFTPLSREWKSCTVSLITHQQSGLRRIMVDEKDKDVSVFWIPETRVAVTREDCKISLKFSNCNKLQAPGNYDTQNGVPVVVATYDPEYPNVTFEIVLNDVENVMKFRGLLLCEDIVPAGSKDTLIAETAQAAIHHTRRKIGDDDQKPCISTWNETIDTDTKSPAVVHDVVSISEIFDLDIIDDKDQLKIAIGYVDKLTYYPAEGPADLSQYVKRSEDGGPAKISVDGDDSATSRLSISTYRTGATEAINRIFTDLMTWRLQKIYSSVDVKISASERYKWGSDRYAAQVTLWSKDDLVRILIRTYIPSKTERNKTLGKIEWFSVSFRGDDSRSSAELDDDVLTIKGVDCTDGTCLSTSDLNTVKDNEENDNKDDKKDKSNSINLELAFKNMDEVDQFRSVVTDQFLNVRSN